MGLSRITNNEKNKDALTLAIEDFKLGYLKEKNTTHAIDCLANFITTNVFLIDLEKNYEFDFSEILNFYELSEKFCQNHIQDLYLCNPTPFYSDQDQKQLFFDKFPYLELV